MEIKTKNCILSFKKSEYTQIELSTNDPGVGTSRAYSTSPVFEVGGKIFAKDNSIYNTYKFALSKTAYSGNAGQGTWDTSYSGSAYNTNDVTITTKAYYILIGRLDNENLSSSDISTLQEKLVYIAPSN